MKNFLNYSLICIVIMLFMIPIQSKALDIFYTVTINTTEGGTANPSDVKRVLKGGNIAIEITPQYGYYIASITINRVSIKPKELLELNDIQDDLAVSIIFKKLKTFLIRASAEDEGSIEPSGVISVPELENQTFYFKPSQGYAPKEINVDGVIQKVIGDRFTFWEVTQDHEIHVFFEKTIQYPIRVSFDGRGEVTPSGEILVNQNADKRFEIKAGIGFIISELLIDGNPIKPVNEFVFRSVDKAHSLYVKFSETRMICGIVKDVDSDERLNNTEIVAIVAADRQVVGKTLTGLLGNYCITGLPPRDDFILRAKVLSETNIRPDREIIPNDEEEKPPLDGEEKPPLDGGEQTIIPDEGEMILPEDQENQEPPILAPSQYYEQYYNNKNTIEKADFVSIVKGTADDINFSMKKLPEIGIHGRIHDGTSGIEGVMIRIYSNKAQFGSMAVSDAQGNYSIMYLIPADDYMVNIITSQDNIFFYAIPKTATVGQYVPTYSVSFPELATRIQPQRPLLKHIDIVIGGGQSIEGTVYGPTGRPVSDIWVNAWSDALSYGNGASTDSNGHYSIDRLIEVSGLEAREKGYVVEVQPKLLPYQAYNAASDRKNAILVSTGRTDIDFYLSAGGKISGSVTNDSGKAIPNAEIIALSLLTRTEKRTITDFLGLYEFIDLPPALDYRIAAVPPGYGMLFYDNETDKMRAKLIPLISGDQNNINFVFSESESIHGVVYVDDQLTPASQGVLVQAFSPSTHKSGVGTTDENGIFRITGLDTNITDYVLKVMAKGYPIAYYSNNNDENEYNDTVFTIQDAGSVSIDDKAHNFVLSSGFAIRGMITMNDKPIGDILIKAWSKDTGIMVTSISKILAPMGYNYELTGLSAGRYSVRLESKSFAIQEMQVMIVDQDIENMNFTVQKPTEYSISGSIKNLTEGDMITIRADSMRSRFTRAIRIKGNGRLIDYEIKGLMAANDYVVMAISKKHPTQFYSQQTDHRLANKIDLSRGNATQIDFILPSQDDMTSITGTVTFPQSASMGQTAWINAFSESARTKQSTQIILADTFTIPYTISGLPKATDYIVSIFSSHYPRQFYNQASKQINAQKIDTSDSTPDIIDFELSQGVSISGMISNSNGEKLTNVHVEAWSESTGSHGSALSYTDGTFVISGLQSCADMIVFAVYPNYGAFYYHSNETVKSKSLAEKISTESGDVSKIYVTIAEGYILQGIVYSNDNIPISDVRVDAWSDTQQAGNSTITDDLGEFIIRGLPQAMDYKIRIIPGAQSGYQEQTLTDISSGTYNLFVYLSTMQTIDIQGSIIDYSENPVASASIELCQVKESGICYFTTSDVEGYYSIANIDVFEKYILNIWPSEDSSLAYYGEAITFQASMEKDISLSAGLSMTGLVTDSDSSPIQNAMVTLSSESSYYYLKTYTDQDGLFSASRLPNVNDYEVNCLADGYIETNETNVSPGQDITLSLESGGTIQGTVKNAMTGKVIENARVEIYSISNEKLDNFGGSALTNENGEYEISGLKIIDQSENTVTDYLVSVYVDGFPVHNSGNAMTGDTVNFNMVNSTDNELSIVVTDTTSTLSTDDVVLIMVYDEDGVFFNRYLATTDLSYTLAGLSSNESYKLNCIGYVDNVEVLNQWAGLGGSGVSSRDNAELFSTSSSVYFSFNQNKRRTPVNITSSPIGPVRNLRSLSHRYFRVYPQNRSEDSVDIPDTVSNNPNVTVTWDSPDDEDSVLGYYTTFNTTSSYSFDSFNAVSVPIISTRKITSEDLEGDDVVYYFHVSPVDVLGRIGATITIAFRIDTVAPTNVSVSTPENTTTQNIILTMGSTGSIDIYISNLNYGEGGSWDSYDTTKLWQVTQGSGTKKIYVEFRDRAYNTNYAMTSTAYEEIFENSPPITNNRTFTIENTMANGDEIGYVEATDADENTLSYTITDNSINQMFLVDESNGKLVIYNKSLIDFINNTIYTFNVNVSDGEYATDSQITLNTMATNSSPFIQNHSFSIYENAINDYPVGTLTATDPDNDPLTYTILSGNDKNIFAIQTNTGQITVSNGDLLDFETTPTYTLTVTVSDGFFTPTAQAVIQLINLNDNSPVVTDTSFVVSENSELGTVVGFILASDSDGNPLTYNLISGNTNAVFSIHPQTGAIEVQTPSYLDFETQSHQYVLTLSAYDGTFSSTGAITITVQNINDNTPNIQDENWRISETIASGSIIGTMHASDADADSLTFSILSGNIDNLFMINPLTGVISLNENRQPDYESVQAYTLTVQVTDGQFSQSSLVIITIQNENDNPPIVSPQTFLVSELAQQNQIVGTISASDLDQDPLTYTIVSGSGSNLTVFSINPITGVIQVNQPNSLDYETIQSYTFTVTVSDHVFSDSNELTITLMNENDNPPVIQDRMFAIAENSPVSTMAGFVFASDADGNTITYRIVEGDPNHAFSINSKTGLISVFNDSFLDYETNQSFALTVCANDFAYSSFATVHIALINKNDNPPSLQDTNFDVFENTISQTKIGTLIASDADFDALTFSIHSQSHANAFTLNFKTGDMFVESSDLLDYETTAELSLIAGVTDGIHAMTATVTIHLMNQNDIPPVATSQTITTLEDQPISITLNASDTEGDALTYSLTSWPTHGHITNFSIQGGCLTYSPNTNYYGQDYFEFTAFDGVSYAASASLTIMIQAVNDSPEISAIHDIYSIEDHAIAPISFTVTDIETPSDYLALTIQSSNPLLIPNQNLLIQGTGLNRSLSIQPLLNQSGNAQITLMVSDGQLISKRIFNVYIDSENDPPMISDLSDVIMSEDADSQSFQVTITDTETAPESMILTVMSNNTTLFPIQSPYVFLTGDSTHRRVHLQPMSNQSGFALITLRVSDGFYQIDTQFSVTVLAMNDPPVVSSISDIFINEDMVSDWIAFTITDQETASNALQVTLMSSNPMLIPVNETAIQVSGTDSMRQLQLSPLANQSGSSRLTLTVFDGTDFSMQSFGVTVLPVNDPPSISSIADQVIQEDQPISSIGFSISDIETDPNQLTLTTQVSHHNIVSPDDITLSGQGSERFVSLVPQANQSGSVCITVSVSDGQLLKYQAFQVTILPVNDSPDIMLENQAYEILEDSVANKITATLSDIETKTKDLLFWAHSSKELIVANEDIVIENKGAVRVITITPLSNCYGSLDLNLFTSDGEITISQTVLLTVLPINDPPVIQALSDLQTTEDQSIGPISFMISDLETNPNQLSLSVLSSNTALIPKNQIMLLGDGTNRELMITPTSNYFGESTISLSVIDPQGLTSNTTFLVTVVKHEGIQLNGVSDFIDIAAHDTLSINGQISLGCRINPQHVQTTQNQVLVSCMSQSNSSAQLYINSQGFPVFDIQFGESNAKVIGTHSLLNDTWVHILCTLDSTHLRLFIDGVLDSELDYSFTPFSLDSPEILIGTASKDPASLLFYGYIDDIQLWQIQITANDIMNVMMHRLQGSESGLIGYWHFKSGQATDYCMNHDQHTNNGTIHKDAPLISAIQNQTTSEDSPIGPIHFTIQDLALPANELILSSASSNPQIVAQEGILLTGSDEQRQITLMPVQDAFGETDITITVTNQKASSIVKFKVSVTPVNDSPIISNLTSISLNEDTPSAPIPFTVTDIETDDSDLTISIRSSNTQCIPIQNILLSGTGSTRQMIINPMPDQFGIARITLTVSDGQAENQSQLTVTVLEINDIPIISSLPDIIINEDTQSNPISFSVTDIETHAKNLTISATSDNETLLPNPMIHLSGTDQFRTLFVTPLNNQFGIAHVTIQVMDDDAAFVEQSFTVTVLSVNDPPSISDIMDQTMNEDATISIPFWVSDTETPFESLSLTVFTNNAQLIPDHAIQMIADHDHHTVVIQPEINKNGTCVIQIRVTDQDESFTEKQFLLTVVPVNDTPEIIFDPVYTLMEDSAPVDISLTVFDIETSANELLVYCNVSDASLISATINGSEQPILTIQPKPNEFGSLSLTLTVQDSEGLYTITSWDITITPVNDPPMISPLMPQLTEEDTPLLSIPIWVNDLETASESLELSITCDNQPLIQKMLIKPSETNATHELDIYPYPNRFGQTIVYMMVSDPEGLTMMSDFLLTITPVNDAPVVSGPNAFTLTEDAQPLIIGLSVTDNETELDALSFDVESDNQTLVSNQRISYVIEGQKLLVTCPFEANQSGQTTLTIQVTDSQHAITDFTCHIHVLPINDPPIISGPYQIILEENTVSESFLITVTDIDSDLSTLQLDAHSNDSGIIGNNPSSIHIEKTDSGYLTTLIPNHNKYGSTQISFTASDPEGLTSIYWLSVTVLDVNQPPIIYSINDQDIEEDSICGPVQVVMVDVDCLPENLSLTVLSSRPDIIPESNIFITDSETESGIVLIAQPLKNMYGQVMIQLTVYDLEGLSDSTQFTITVHPVNDCPYMSSIQDIIIQEDSISQGIAFTVTDIETPANELTVYAMSHAPQLIAEQGIQITQQAGIGKIRITPNVNAWGSGQIDLIVKDAMGLTSVTSFEVTVEPVNDPPVISDIQDITMNEDDVLSDLSFLISDPDHLANQLYVSFYASDGILVPENAIEFNGITNTRLFSITLPSNRSGESDMTFIVHDPDGLYSSSMFHLTVKPVNDPPMITNIQDIEIDEDTVAGPISFMVLDAETSPDNLIVSCVSSDTQMIPQNNIVLGGSDSNRTITFKPGKNLSGITTLTLQVTDDVLSSAEASFKVSIISVNDPPVPVNAMFTINEDQMGGGMLNATDVDSQTLSYFVYKQSEFGTVQIPVSSNPSFIYTPNPDFYGDDVFEFKVMDSEGLFGIGKIRMQVESINDPPVANAGQNQTGIEGETLLLLGQSSYDKDDGIQSCEWIQMSGTNVLFANRLNCDTSIVLPDIWLDETIQFKLIVTDKSGLTSQDSVSITIIDVSAPVASISATPITGKVPLAVQFSDQSRGKITDWLWTFGDGYQSHGHHPLHTYYQAGTYQVQLTVKGPYGENQLNKSQTITVLPDSLSANFSVEPENGFAPLQVQFTPQLQGEISTIAWRIGDIVQSGVFEPMYLFNVPGMYTVTLLVSGNGESLTVTKPSCVEVLGTTISGQVTGSDQPNYGLSNYYVEARSNKIIRSALTTDNGYYTITQLPMGLYKVSVWPPFNQTDYLYQVYQGKEKLKDADLVDTTQGNMLSIDFILEKSPNVMISGRVHDGVKGLSQMEINCFSESLEWGTTALSDITGYYTLTGIKPATDYKVWVYDPDESLDYYFVLPEDQIPGTDIPETSEVSEARATHITPNQSLNHIDLVIRSDQWGMIGGKVVLESGKPMSSVSVYAWSSALQHGNMGVTDAAGNYTITGLTAVDCNNAIEKGYVVTVHPKQYPIQVFGAASHQNAGEPVCTGRLDIHFYLKSGGTITGKVENTEGTALSKVWIQAWSKSQPGTYVGTTETNERGEYTLQNLPYAKDYVIGAFGNNYPPLYYQNASSIKNATILSLFDKPDQTILFVLDKGAVIQGIVSKESDDSPFNQTIWVHAWSKQTQSGNMARIESNGQFEITGLNPEVNDYIVNVSCSGFVPAYYHSNGTVYMRDQAEPIAPGLSSRHITLVRGSTIMGRVMSKGDVISGIRVQIQSKENQFFLETITTDNQTQNYTLVGIPSGDYSVSIMNNQTLIQSESLSINQTKVIDFTITDSTDREISGVIKGLETGMWAEIEVFSISRAFTKSIKLLGTGSNQPYFAKELPKANDYYVVFHVNQGPALYYDAQSTWENASSLDLMDQDARNIDFNVPSVDQFSYIAGKISFPSTAQIGETVKVYAQSLSKDSFGEVTVICDATKEVAYTITGLIKAPDYIVSIHSDAYQDQYYLGTGDVESAQTINLSDSAADIQINFYVATGAEFYGQVNHEANHAISNLMIEAWSSKTSARSSIQTDANGQFILSGLPAADDYIISAKTPDHALFYYYPDKVVNSQEAAMKTSLGANEQKEIIITITDCESIQGTIYDDSGNPIPYVWLHAWSDALNSGNGMLSQDNGQFIIQGLIPGKDYQVTAYPDPLSHYVKQTQTQIQTNSGTLHFVLNKQTGFQVSGTITDNRGNTISKARIELWQGNQTLVQNTLSNGAGTYQLNGVSRCDSCSLYVYPPADSSLAFQRTELFPINNNVTLPITLSTGYGFKGTISDKSTSNGISGARITIISSTQGVYANCLSDLNGRFEIQQIPFANDYRLSVFHDQFESVIQSNQTPAEGILINMQGAGFIKGNITDQSTGQGIQNVLVVVESLTFGISSVGLSDSQGRYQINGLPVSSTTGQAIGDYRVFVYAENYPVQFKTNRRSGDTVHFSFSNTNTIEGTIENAVDSVILAELFEADGPFIKRISVNESGAFIISGIESKQSYELRFSGFEAGTLMRSQWYSDGLYGVTSRNQAKQVSGNMKLAFRFSNTRSFDVNTASQCLATKDIKTQNALIVSELMSPTHVTTQQVATAISNQSEIRVTLTAPVSDNGISGFYTLFNEKPDYSFDYVNTANITPIQSTETISRVLSGNNVTYYFHIAVVDKNGNIGTTQTLGGFQIDTEAPSYPFIQVPETTATANITLRLAASDASEMRISGKSYACCGIWEAFTSRRQWTVSSEPGLKTIFVQFRDRAGNISQTYGTTTYYLKAENTPPIIDPMNAIGTEDTRLSIFLQGEDPDGNSVKYSILKQPLHGFVQVRDELSGFVVYEPSPNYYGTDYFLCITTDGESDSEPATVTIQINPINDEPQVNNRSYTTQMNTPIYGIMEAIDPDGDTLTYSISSQGWRGQVELLNPQTGLFLYTPMTNEYGSDSFMFNVSDAGDIAYMGVININIKSKSSPLSDQMDIQGSVIDLSYEYISQVEVNVLTSEGQSLGISTQTDGLGYFEFKNITFINELPMYLQFQKTGYGLTMMQVAPSNQTSVYNTRMISSSDPYRNVIDGYCHSLQGILSQVEIKATRHGESIQLSTALSDLEGYYQLTLDQRDAPYDLYISKSSYQSKTITGISESTDITLQVIQPHSNTIPNIGEEDDSCFIGVLRYY